MSATAALISFLCKLPLVGTLCGVALAVRDRISQLLLRILVTEHRWIFTVLFLLPASIAFDVFWYIRSLFVEHLYKRRLEKQHATKVADIQSQVREWRKAGAAKPMCTARPSYLNMSFRFATYKDAMSKIRVELYDVVGLDEAKRIVRVEPYVSCGQLSRYLIPKGWTVPVLPEMDELTVGGLIMGFGVETSSHKYGLFQHICVAYEMVVADGSVVRCSADENPELFYAVPWSYGTLGFLVSADIRVIPCKPYVHMRYIPCHSRKQLCKLMIDKSIEEKDDFVEALGYSPEEGVVMLGNMVADCPPPGKLNPIGRWYKPWFYEHVRSFLKSDREAEEYIPLRDYYHRHTRSIFWALHDIIPFGNHWLFRYLLGWAVPPKVAFLKNTQTDALKKMYEDNQVFQDMLVPIATLEQSLRLFDEVWYIYPLWLCPMKIPHTPIAGMVNPPGAKDAMFIDIGAYGTPQIRPFRAEATHRQVEEYVRQVKGFQALYADTYMTRKEHREMFDHKLYDQMRKRYQCDGAFPEAYDKINKHARK